MLSSAGRTLWRGCFCRDPGARLITVSSENVRAPPAVFHFARRLAFRILIPVAALILCSHAMQTHLP